MMKLISSKEAVAKLEAAGMHTNVQRLQAGLKQGVYPFGHAIQLKEYVFEIFDELLDQWIAERSSQTEEVKE